MKKARGKSASVSRVSPEARALHEAAGIIDGHNHCMHLKYVRAQPYDLVSAHRPAHRDAGSS